MIILTNIKLNLQQKNLSPYEKLSKLLDMHTIMS